MESMSDDVWPDLDDIDELHFGIRFTYQGRKYSVGSSDKGHFVIVSEDGGRKGGLVWKDEDTAWRESHNGATTIHVDWRSSVRALLG